MKLTEREKLLILLAPLAIILACYGWWYNIFQRPKSLAIEQAHQAAVAAQPTPSDLLAQQSRKKMLDREVAGLQKQKDGLDVQAAAATGREADSRRRIENEDLLRRASCDGTPCRSWTKALSATRRRQNCRFPSPKPWGDSANRRCSKPRRFAACDYPARSATCWGPCENWPQWKRRRAFPSA